MKKFKVKYSLDGTPAALVFPGVVVTKYGEVVLLDSYATNNKNTVDKISSEDYLEVSEDSFKYAKEIYYSAVDMSSLLSARQASPKHYIAIEDIIDTLPDRVESKNNTK